MAKTEKKGVDTSLMVGGRSVPVTEGVATPPPEKLTSKEVLETLKSHEDRLDAVEDMAFGEAKELLEEIVKGALGNFNARIEALEKAATEEAKK